MTDLDQPARRISDLYAKRMGIEQLFRDAKNKRNGWSLRDTGIQHPDRLDRLILVLAIAYLLLIAMGLYALQTHDPRHWSNNTRLNSLSAFAIGRLMLHRLHATIPKLLDVFLQPTPNWG